MSIKQQMDDISNIDNGDDVLCDGCIQILEKVDILSDTFDSFITSVKNTYTDQTTKIDKLEKQILVLNNKIEKDHETQHFMIITADIIQRMYNKIKSHIKSSQEYKATYGRFWQDDFWDDVKNGDPLAGQIYCAALAAYSIDKAEYERIVRLKDRRNAAYHADCPLDTPDAAIAALDLLQKQIPRIATEENKAIIALLKKYARVL